jgi:hypothetical protein
MARIIDMQIRKPNRDSAARPLDSTQRLRIEDDRAEATITQALYMVRLYTEILAMDETIIGRIRQLVVAQSNDADYEASLDNMRLVLAQLEKIGRRIAYWNARLRSLLKGQMSRPAPRPPPRPDVVST